jgi:hemoglobin-like flavoprotein
LDSSAIEHTLQLAAEAEIDLTPYVYARLFREHPEMEALFIRDTNGSVRGEMLARVFEMILDFIDRRSYGAQMIQCEVVTHEGYGVPPEIFGLFFHTVADTLRDVLSHAWTAPMDDAWRTLVEQMTWFANHPSQTLEATVG